LLQIMEEFQMKRITLFISIALVLLVPLMMLAGNIDSPADLANLTSAMYTLEDIYQRLVNGTAGSKSAGFDEPAGGPASTGHTLDDVMAAAPEVDATNGAATSDVASGKTFWGLTSGEWGLQTGTGTIATFPAPVPKTGQTTSYTTGDDGDLEKGVAWPSPRFTDNSDGTVTDNLTGLIWLKNANVGASNTPWATAFTWVNELNASGTMNGNNAGDISNSGSHQTDWRLPNLQELLSLIDYGFDTPALSNTAGTGQWVSDDPFTGVVLGNYWSSSTYVDSPTYAWHVSFSYGQSAAGHKTGLSDFVWPVRGGQ
jgi:hypothetical protein